MITQLVSLDKIFRFIHAVVSFAVCIVQSALGFRSGYLQRLMDLRWAHPAVLVRVQTAQIQR